MSVYDNIRTLIATSIEERGDVQEISAANVALDVQAKITTTPLPPMILYTSLEHLKQMARSMLAKRFDPDDDENEVNQEDMFEDVKLQRRYPTPHRRDEERSYKLLEHLTEDEVIWNVTALQRSAHSRLKHARALEAWSQARRFAA